MSVNSVPLAGVALSVAILGGVIVADMTGGSSSPSTVATPLSCAGVVVARPLTPQEAVRALLQGAHDIGDPAQGAGRLDICASLAIAATITAPPMLGGVAHSP